MTFKFRFSLLFIAAGIAGMYVHEIGHALFGWMQGIAVVPTPAKEYVLRTQVEWHQMALIALGGPLASAAVISGTLLWYLRHRHATADAILSGILVIPGIYTLRFLIVGRGHDGLEWQEAKKPLGLNPPGHPLDLAFFVLFACGCAALAAISHRY